MDIQKKLKDSKWRIIEGKKKWVGNCPKCNIEVIYSQKIGLKRALEENRVCLLCRQEKIEKTCMKKYGSKSPLDCKSIFEKTQKTMFKKYGKTNVQLMMDGYKNKDTGIELKVRNILENNNIVFERNFEIFDKNKNLYRYYDFKINNILIECDGDYWHSLQHNIINDKYKDELAIKNGYLLLRFKESEIMKKDFNVNLIKSLETAKI